MKLPEWAWPDSLLTKLLLDDCAPFSALPPAPSPVDLNLTAAVLALLSLTMMAMGSICIAMSLSKGVPFFLKPASFCFILSGATARRHVLAEMGEMILTAPFRFCLNPLPSPPTTARRPGPPLRAGLPPVGACAALQRPPGAAAPRTVLVGGLRGLGGGHPGGGGGSLRPAHASLQPLGEMLAAQEQRHLASRRRQSCAALFLRSEVPDQSDFAVFRATPFLVF